MAAKDNCIFCRIIDRGIPSKIVFENDSVLAFEDVSPQAPTHILVIPKRHIARMSDLGEPEIRLVGEMVLAATRIAREAGIESSGYRIVLNCNEDAGQEVFHIHMHLMGGRKFSWPPG